MTKSEEFFCRTSGFFAGILNVFQEKFAKLCEKITAFGGVVIFQTSPRQYRIILMVQLRRRKFRQTNQIDAGNRQSVGKEIFAV